MALLTPASSMRTRRFALRLLTLLALFGATFPAASQQAAKPDDLKAAFVFQFANYVQWPAGRFKDESAPLVIGIVGNETMLKSLTTAVRGKSVGTRSFSVIDVTDAKTAETCHILYIHSEDDMRVDDYLDLARAKPILTVSDDDNFTSEGGIIRLFEKDKKLRFEINVDEAQRSSLTISSKLLGLAQIVRDKS